MAQITITDALFERIKKYTERMHVDINEFIQNQLEMTMYEAENPNKNDEKDWSLSGRK